MFRGDTDDEEATIPPNGNDDDDDDDDDNDTGGFDMPGQDEVDLPDNQDYEDQEQEQEQEQEQDYQDDQDETGEHGLDTIREESDNEDDQQNISHHVERPSKSKKRLQLQNLLEEDSGHVSDLSGKKSTKRKKRTYDEEEDTSGM